MRGDRRGCERTRFVKRGLGGGWRMTDGGWWMAFGGWKNGMTNVDGKIRMENCKLEYANDKMLMRKN